MIWLVATLLVIFWLEVLISFLWKRFDFDSKFRYHWLKYSGPSRRQESLAYLDEWVANGGFDSWNARKNRGWSDNYCESS